MLDRERILTGIETECEAMSRLYQKSAYGIRKICSRLKFFINDGEYDATLTPVDMVLHCPNCSMQHVDAPEPGGKWTNPPHKSHLCHGCGTIWRPASIPTNGVVSLEKLGHNDTWPMDLQTILKDSMDYMNPPCQECLANTPEEAETRCKCAGDKDSCHGSVLWPD